MQSMCQGTWSRVLFVAMHIDTNFLGKCIRSYKYADIVRPRNPTSVTLSKEITIKVHKDYLQRHLLQCCLETDCLSRSGSVKGAAGRSRVCRECLLPGLWSVGFPPYPRLSLHPSSSPERQQALAGAIKGPLLGELLCSPCLSPRSGGRAGGSLGHGRL